MKYNLNFRAKMKFIKRFSEQKLYFASVCTILSLNTWLSIFKVKFAWKCMQLSIHVWIFAPLAKKLSFSSKSIAKKMVSAWGRKWRKKCVNLLIFYLKDIFFWVEDKSPQKLRNVYLTEFDRKWRNKPFVKLTHWDTKSILFPKKWQMLLPSTAHFGRINSN